MSRHFFKLIKFENNSSDSYLHVETTPECLKYNLTLIDTSHSAAFGGQIAENDISNFVSKTRLDAEKLKTYIHEAFTNDNDGYKFFFSQDDEILKIKKIIDAKGAVFIISSTKMKKLPFIDAISMFMNFSIKCIADERTQKENLSFENEKLSKELSLANNLNEETITQKASLEKHLYACFLEVINSKKIRIKDLEKKIEHLEKDKLLAFEPASNKQRTIEKVDTANDSTEKISKSVKPNLSLEQPLNFDEKTKKTCPPKGRKRVVVSHTTNSSQTKSAKVRAHIPQESKPLSPPEQESSDLYAANTIQDSQDLLDDI